MILLQLDGFGFGDGFDGIGGDFDDRYGLGFSGFCDGGGVGGGYGGGFGGGYGDWVDGESGSPKEVA